MSSAAKSAQGMPSMGSINFALGAAVFNDSDDEPVPTTPVAKGSARNMDFRAAAAASAGDDGGSAKPAGDGAASDSDSYSDDDFY